MQEPGIFQDCVDMWVQSPSLDSNRASLAVCGGDYWRHWPWQEASPPTPTLNPSPHAEKCQSSWGPGDNELIWLPSR